MEQKPALVKLTQRCVIENTIANKLEVLGKINKKGVVKWTDSGCSRLGVEFAVN